MRFAATAMMVLVVACGGPEASPLTSGDSAVKEKKCKDAGGCCGDGIVQAGETCDTGGVDTATCNASCTLPVCGDAHANAAAGEQCDTGGESAACDADCTVPACGDGRVNAAAGEQCDSVTPIAGCVQCQIVCS
jgi:hypothetical protein